MSLLKSAAFAIAAAALAACGNLGTPAPRVAVYDFGLIEAVDPPSAIAPGRVEVRVPSWLATGAMQYRIDARQPAQREVFLHSRWASQPSELLELALHRALSGDGRGGDCRLQLDLDEFLQVFPSAARSHTELVVRAQLLSARGDAVLARRGFVIRENAPSADADGGVLAHRAGVRRLVGELDAWLRELAADAASSPNMIESCNR